MRDAPLTGRVLFEAGIREHRDRGRPEQVQCIFDRQVPKRTPGPFRPRLITDGVVPSLHSDDQQTRLKQ